MLYTIPGDTMLHAGDFLPFSVSEFCRRIVMRLMCWGVD